MRMMMLKEARSTFFKDEKEALVRTRNVAKASGETLMLCLNGEARGEPFIFLGWKLHCIIDCFGHHEEPYSK